MEKGIVPFLQQMKDARKEMKDPFFLLPTYGQEGR
jgi:hypothetical protein